MKKWSIRPAQPVRNNSYVGAIVEYAKDSTVLGVGFRLARKRGVRLVTVSIFSALPTLTTSVIYAVLAQQSATMVFTMTISAILAFVKPATHKCLQLSINQSLKH